MISRYEVMLNSIPMSNLDPKIQILDIRYPPVTAQDTTFTTAKRQGARVSRRYYAQRDVTISFGVYEYDIRKRMEICAAVNRWAKNGGVLETNDKPGQFLQCVCTKYPSVESAKDWTKALSVTFTAYEVPFWQEKNQATATLTGTSGNGFLYVPGDVDGAFVEISANANAALASVTFGVNGRTLTLSGLSVAQDQVINIAYDAKAIQSIKVGTTSLLDKRTGVDDLLAKAGMNTLTLTAGASVSAVFKVRGWWM